jgi:predicted  nucleic acid-binding Zn-ribbon protein
MSEFDPPLFDSPLQGPLRKALHCPYCGRVLYSRKQAHCGYCQGVLPRGIRFNEEQIEAIEAEISAIERERQHRREEEEKERKRLVGIP